MDTGVLVARGLLGLAVRVALRRSAPAFAGVGG
jgi:hypothetical protein